MAWWFASWVGGGLGFPASAGIPCVRFGVGQVSNLPLRVRLRCAKGRGDHEGRPYGFRGLPLDGRDGFRGNGGVTRLRRLGSV